MTVFLTIASFFSFTVFQFNSITGKTLQYNISDESFQEDIFPGLKRRKIELDFKGGEVTSDGAVLLLRQVDRKLGLLRRAAKILSRYDERQSGKVDYDVYSILVQRVYGIACTYIELHGKQEGGFFNGYYDENCFLPLYICLLRG